MRRPAILVLEDGRTFHGEAYGSIGETFGEAVFATGMTGYQETLTDPSYHRQVVVMTAPQIGNTGVNGEDDESARIWVAGYAVREASRTHSSWRASGGLEDRLVAEGIVGICGLDTRALTRHLRERGAMRVGVSSVDDDATALLERVRRQPPMAGADPGTPGAGHADLRDLFRSPDPGPRPGPAHLQAQVRAPGHQPAGAGVGHRQGRGDRPQPRLRDRGAVRRGRRVRGRGVRNQPHLPQRRRG